MPTYSGFDEKNAKTILEAFVFVGDTILGDESKQKSLVNPRYHSLVESEYKKRLEPLNKAAHFFEHGSACSLLYELSEQDNKDFMDMAKSALKSHLEYFTNLYRDTGVSIFELKAQTIRDVLNLDAIRAAERSDVFDNYFSNKNMMNKEVFISYSTEDKRIAGRVAEFLRKSGLIVFLAHEDIEVTTEWREELLKHLGNSGFIISILTPNYAKSVWGNQEVGFMMGKGRPNIPLLFERADIRDFGFLEARQAVKVNEDTLEEAMQKILVQLHKKNGK